MIEHTMHENLPSPCPDGQPAMTANSPISQGENFGSVPHIAVKGEFDMVDTRGYICPTPVLMVQKALKDRPATVEVLAEAGAAVENITRFAHSQGYQVSKTADGPDYKLTLTK